MRNDKIFNVAFRRKREGRTDYKMRLRLLLSKKPRMVVRIFSKNIMAQLVAYVPAGDKVLASASSKELQKLGWKANSSNLPTAYLVGALLAKKAIAAKHKEAVLDIGLRHSMPGCLPYGVLNGAVEGGLLISHSEDIFPTKERVRGKHIAAYAAQLKKQDTAKYNAVYSRYLKNGVNPEDIEKHFDIVKKKIEESR